MNKDRLIYIAGFFDGEGCIGIYHSKGKKTHLRTQLVQNSSPDVENLFAVLRDEFGGNYRGHLSSNGRRKFNWQLNGDKAAVFLESILPWMVLKKDQAEVAVMWQRARPKPVRDKRGRIESKAAGFIATDIAVARLVKALKRQSLDEVMANQADLVKPIHTLRQIVCVKG